MPVTFMTTNTGHTHNNQAVNAMIGKYLNPIKMIIQHESDLCAKNDDIVKSLYNMGKSNKYGESVVVNNEFDIFAPTEEGGAANQVSFGEKSSKFIEHAQFMSQFVVTRKMMDDALTNIIRQKASNFTRSYYRTRNLFATKMLVGATAGSGETDATNIAFGPTGKTQNFDITCADGKALFHKAHVLGDTTVSNRFHYIMSAAIDTSVVETALSAAVDKIRNMKDENGNALGYTADTIMIPGDDYALEKAVKKVLGSEFSSNSAGALSGAINIQYGNWTLIINPLWTRTQATSHPMIVFSSRANKQLGGSMFFDRTALEVNDFIDPDTLNYKWTGYARFSAGFVTYKHICVFDLLDKASTLGFDGAAVANKSTAVTL